MLLTSENYYSREANEEYLSVSQYKDFMGTYGKPGCEEYALANAVLFDTSGRDCMCRFKSVPI